jgi:hypothetical protein
VHNSEIAYKIESSKAYKEIHGQSLLKLISEEDRIDLNKKKEKTVFH